MSTSRWFGRDRILTSATRVGALLATMLWALAGMSAARAQLTLAYSFEFDLDGFGPNGGGMTVTQDTIGATEGVGSMKVDVVAPATFVGALTTTLIPEMGDPPGFDRVEFDLTVVENFPAEAFVDLGITIFGMSQPDAPGGPQFGLQAQFQANQVPLGNLAPGTHPIQMTLTDAVHPLTFVHGSFNDIFGEVGSGPNDLIPTGFQIYINKSETAPWIGYFDNIRLGMTPAPDADFNDDGMVDAEDLSLWEIAYGDHAGGDANGDLVSDGEDFLIWQQQRTAPGGASVVPEPASLMLAGAMLLSLWDGRRRGAAPKSLARDKLRK